MKICPCLITKRHWLPMFEKKITGDLFFKQCRFVIKRGHIFTIPFRVKFIHLIPLPTCKHLSFYENWGSCHGYDLWIPFKSKCRARGIHYIQLEVQPCKMFKWHSLFIMFQNVTLTHQTMNQSWPLPSTMASCQLNTMCNFIFCDRCYKSARIIVISLIFICLDR